MGQTWRSLLFAHWALPEDELRPHVPPELPLDTFDERAWLGITPFWLTGLQLVATPAFPRMSSFPELNVRTYVTLDERPGIFFFSLDAGSELAVRAARRFYRLPYFRARMRCRRVDGDRWFESRRVEDDRSFEATYRPSGPPAPAAPGTLEWFLAERYCLYAVAEGAVWRSDIHHPPWPLQPATAEILTNTMPPSQIELPDEPPLLHFAARQDVLVWPPARVRRRSLERSRATRAPTRPRTL